jgi:hypothetical protein
MLILLNYAWTLPFFGFWGCAVYLIYICSNDGHKAVHPPPRPGIVPRRRLMERMNAGSANGLRIVRELSHGCHWMKGTAIRCVSSVAESLPDGTKIVEQDPFVLQDLIAEKWIKEWIVE